MEVAEYGTWYIILLTEQRDVTFSDTSKKSRLLASVLEMKYRYCGAADFTLGQEAKGSALVRSVCAQPACAFIGWWALGLKIHIDICNSGHIDRPEEYIPRIVAATCLAGQQFFTPTW